VDLAHVVRADRRDGRALVGDGLDKALGLQVWRGFTRQRSADIQGPAELPLHQRLAGLEPAVQDCLPNSGSDLLSQGCGPTRDSLDTAHVVTPSSAESGRSTSAKIANSSNRSLPPDVMTRRGERWPLGSTRPPSWCRLARMPAVGHSDIRCEDNGFRAPRKAVRA